MRGRVWDEGGGGGRSVCGCLDFTVCGPGQTGVRGVGGKVVGGGLRTLLQNGSSTFEIDLGLLGGSGLISSTRFASVEVSVNVDRHAAQNNVFS